LGAARGRWVLGRLIRSEAALQAGPYLDLSDPELIARVRAAGHHERTPSAYLGTLPVLEEGAFGPVQWAQIREAERFLTDRSVWSDPDRFRPLPVPGLIGARVVATERPSRNLVLLVAEEPVACVRSGLPLVAPDWRGRGLGALLVLVSDIEGGRFLCPAAYSVEGARARRSAHALQVRIVEGDGYSQMRTGAEAPVPIPFRSMADHMDGLASSSFAFSAALAAISAPSAPK